MINFKRVQRSGSIQHFCLSLRCSERAEVSFLGQTLLSAEPAKSRGMLNQPTAKRR